MFIKPVDRTQTPDKNAWDNLTLHINGVFYALFGTGRRTEINPSAYPIGIDVYKSTDGVHWQSIAKDLLPLPGAHAGFGAHRIDDFIYYYPTCSGPDQDVHFKVYRSKDFIHWEHLGDECDVYIDRSFYHERWDELMILQDVDENNRAVLYGYISSEIREDIGEPGLGLVRSYDGIHWEVLPPAQIIWGDLPSQHMEVNFVVKIDDRYYLSMSGRAYLDNFGYSLYTFIGNSYAGPFYPDLEKFRLAGTTRRDITWLGHTIQTQDGLLLALWLSHEKTRDLPSQSFSIGSLKRLICENGHLRLSYWEGTDIAKGDQIVLCLSAAKMDHPAPNVQTFQDWVKIPVSENNVVEVRASRDGTILLFNEHFNRHQGFILEGTMCARENRHDVASHQKCAAAGFYFEEKPGTGTAVLAETLGVTRIGPLHYADHKITDRDDYTHASGALIQYRSEPLQGTLAFNYEDTVGPLGNASVCGIHHGRTHTFSLLARDDIFELYIDNGYVQTYLLPETMSGRIGLCVVDGTCLFDLQAYTMNF